MRTIVLGFIGAYLEEDGIRARAAHRPELVSVAVVEPHVLFRPWGTITSAITITARATALRYLPPTRQVARASQAWRAGVSFFPLPPGRGKKETPARRNQSQMPCR